MIKKTLFILIIFVLVIVGISPYLTLVAGSGSDSGGMMGPFFIIIQIFLFPFIWGVSYFIYYILKEFFGFELINKKVFLATYPIMAVTISVIVSFAYPTYKIWLEQKHLNYDAQFKNSIRMSLTNHRISGNKHLFTINVNNSGSTVYRDAKFRVKPTCDYSYRNFAFSDRVQLLPGLNSFNTSTEIQEEILTKSSNSNETCNGIDIELMSFSPYPITELLFSFIRFSTYIKESFSFDAI